MNFYKERLNASILVISLCLFGCKAFEITSNENLEIKITKGDDIIKDITVEAKYFKDIGCKKSLTIYKDGTYSIYIKRSGKLEAELILQTDSDELPAAPFQGAYGLRITKNSPTLGEVTFSFEQGTDFIKIDKVDQWKNYTVRFKNPTERNTLMILKERKKFCKCL